MLRTPTIRRDNFPGLFFVFFIIFMTEHSNWIFYYIKKTSPGHQLKKSWGNVTIMVICLWKYFSRIVDTYKFVDRLVITYLSVYNSRLMLLIILSDIYILYLKISSRHNNIICINNIADLIRKKKRKYNFCCKLYN